MIALRAYRNALASGDMALARRAAAVMTRSGVAPADVAILDLADAIRSKNAGALEAALTRIESGPLDFLIPVIRAWVAYDRREDAIALLDRAEGGGLSRRYIAEHRALLLIATRQTDEAIAALRVAIAADGSSLDLRWNAATLLAARGKRSLALTLLAGDDPVMTALRGNLVRAPRPGAAFGAARIFTRLAADLGGQQTQLLTILLTRAALSLDPGDDRARLLLAEALAGEQAFERAQVTLDEIDQDSPFHEAALAARIDLRRKRGDQAAAATLAASLAGRPDASTADRQRYADLLSDAGDYAQAAEIYAQGLAAAGDDATWVQHLQLGGALERAGQWDAALPHLRKAVELAPQQAVALNYLGYSLADRGIMLDEAEGLLERASRLRPDDAAITDSLGWVYFKRGDVARALPLLEKAAQAEPSSVTINEHLGDAYWRAGRRFEARYAWRAAAIYADADEQARLQGKLANGLKLRAAAN